MSLIIKAYDLFASVSLQMHLAMPETKKAIAAT